MLDEFKEYFESTGLIDSNGMIKEYLRRAFEAGRKKGYEIGIKAGIEQVKVDEWTSMVSK